MGRARTSKEPDHLVPGSYYTDGERLYRVDGVFGGGRLYTLEDCSTLELMIAPVGELMALSPLAAGAGRPVARPR
jgi:hypothetical protein